MAIYADDGKQQTNKAEKDMERHKVIAIALETGIAVQSQNMAALLDVPTWDVLQTFAEKVAAAEREKYAPNQLCKHSKS